VVVSVPQAHAKSETKQPIARKFELVICHISHGNDAPSGRDCNAYFA
jgi:hypothetical protein